MQNCISQRIIEVMAPVAQDRTAVDVRIGLIYTSVQLDNGAMGIAWTGKRRLGGCPSHREPLTGRSAVELLSGLLNADDAVLRSVALATANALVATMPKAVSVSTDILTLLNIQPSEQVTMVGYFGPLLPRLQAIGCHLDILELKRDFPGTLTPEQGRGALSQCDVAIITGTAIVTNTLDELISNLGMPRAVVLLGPSSLMCPEVFLASPITHLAGAWVRDPTAVAREISEGGGTKTLKSYLEFATICLQS
ncbi:Rossmann-like domain-containing protein [Celerinatantimonas sp. YJH-8]|uniref:Rossmann-like domain-containing protein n=1 Tax=Celerinatantimonas sp. YJH-8 TaxID=3228714 RepID=UPI0038BF30FE